MNTAKALLKTMFKQLFGIARQLNKDITMHKVRYFF